LGGGLSLNKLSGTNLQPVLEQVVAEIKASFPERRISVDFHLIETFEADHSRIGQLFSNLLGNAVTHGDPESPIKITALVDQGIFELTVANGGDPISPAVIDQLFQPFYRGKVRPNHQGLGLGLYIASEIAKAHGGRLEVRSGVTQTSFTFRMPVSVGT
jgi:phosphoserine phosphatase RsbU/P